MTALVLRPPAPSGRSRRRAAVAAAVLVGLFVIHALSALTALACTQEAAPIAAQPVVQVALGEFADTLASVDPLGETLTSAHCGCDCVDPMDELCIPLRESSSGALVTALLLGLAVLPALWSGIAGFIYERTRRARGPGRPGPSLLLKACVSRT